ncbi:MAG TPA: formimidoylglutamate deiminase [Burkholderiaceae bacterium]
MPEATLLWAPSAWLAGGWQQAVLLEAGGDGSWSGVTAGVHTPPPQAQRLAGPAIPGLVNAHSHAFQRAFAALAERHEVDRGHESDDHDGDDFWSWRDRMYRVAQRIEPEQMQAIAAQLYIELLRGGYTHVCEFHYLQHRPDGSLYPDPLVMSWALAAAGAEAGMPLTLLPALYERAGFAQSGPQSGLNAAQQRFRADAQQVCAMRAAIATHHSAGVRAGLAIHSLRAAAPASIARLRQLAEDFDGPIHIHVAEQADEVFQCRAALGAPPIEWLSQQGALDRRWQLVHATHATAAEIELAARSGAGVVLCPSTEANLGDGTCDLPAWLDSGAPISIGSDSHVTRSWREEVRWLEYGQRLLKRRRNVGAGRDEPSTAGRLFARLVEGSAAAAGFPCWGLRPGARADLLVVDRSDSSLLGVPVPQVLDALVFSSPGRQWRDVMVAGRWQIWNHVHTAAARVAERFERAMGELWGSQARGAST